MKAHVELGAQLVTLAGPEQHSGNDKKFASRAPVEPIVGRPVGAYSQDVERARSRLSFFAHSSFNTHLPKFSSE
jgi:hypothetical protein